MSSSPIAGMVAGAKAALSNAEKKFPSSMAPKDKPAASPAPAAPKPSAAKRLATGVSQGLKEVSREADDTAKGIQWREQQQRETTPQYHKGGKIKKDGEQKIVAEKGETVLPNEDKEKALNLAVEHLKGMGDGMSRKSKGKKKEAAKKEEPKHEEHKVAAKKHGKRHGKVHTVTTKMADDGTFMMTNQHHPMEDGAMVPDTTHTSPDMDGVHDHMEEHMGTPNPGEAEASAPPVAAGPQGA